MLLGWADAMVGNRTDGIATMRHALVEWHQIGSETYRTYYLGILAETLLLDGQVQPARKLIDEAVHVMERTGERFFEAELHRLRGEATHLSEPHDESAHSAAENHYRRALQVAARQKTRLPELRAATGLTRHAKRRGTANHQAQTELRRVADWFLEGSDTLDLQAARELLAG